MKKKSTSQFSIFILGIFIMMVVIRFMLDQVNTSNSNSKPNLASTKVGTTDDVSKNATALNINNNFQQNSKVNDRKPASEEQVPIIPEPDAPIMKLLEQFDLDAQKDAVIMGYDTWFVSDKYSAVPLKSFKPDMGRLVHQTDLFAVVELSNRSLQDLYPPLVISYSTGSIVPITGDLVIKYDQNSLPVKNYLKKFQETLVIDNKEVQSLHLLQFSLKRKSEVFKIYGEINGAIGNHNIVSVELIKRYFNIAK